MKMSKKTTLAILFSLIIIVTGVLYLTLFKKKPKRPNILFIIVDTLRSDHLGCYGYNAIKTPNIDHIARHGTLFKNTIAQAPLTLPSHCSMFTSTYPQFNGVRDNGNYRLDDDAVTLAEVLRDNGYETAAFISTVVLDSRYGLDQGFNTYDDELDKQKKKVIRFMSAERRAEAVTAQAKDWLEQNKNIPFFLWVHYYDPHTVYNPPEPYKKQYSNNLYDGEIAYTDNNIGTLLQALNDTGKGNETLIIFASDHGEGLGEHGETGHAVFIYDSTLKVPLIFSWPGEILKGSSITTQVRLIDIMPTVLDLLGIKKPATIQGKSLLKLLHGNKRPLKEPAYSESLYAHRRYNWSPLYSLRTDEWKYIRSPEPELYNIITDPEELKNRAGDQPDIIKDLDNTLENFLAKTSSEKATDTHIDIDESTREKLVSLGYIQGTVETDGDKPVPREMIQILEKINLGDRLANNGMIDDAIRTLHEVIATDPDNMEVYSHLAQCYKEKKEYEKAAKYFRKAASFRPEDPMVHDGLGHAYKNMGMIDEAFREFQIAHELDPEDASVINSIGWYYQQKHRYQKAMEQFLTALSLDKDIPEIHVNMAICYRKQGNIKRAEDEITKALDLDPELSFAQAELCAITASKGNVAEAIPYCKKAIELNDESFDGYNNLGFCYEMTGQYVKAIENYKKAMEIQPWNTLVYNNTANSYLKMRDYTQARKYLQKSLELDPDDKEIARVLREINKRL